MENVFLTLLNRSITAGWLILAIILLRLLLRKSPRWISCLLWAFAAFRLVCPFSLESIFSMIPSRKTISHEAVLSPAPSIDSGVRIVDNMVNPVLRTSFAPKPETPVSPLQFWLTAAGIVWAAGAALMLLYALAGYIRLYRRVRTAVRLEGFVYVSEFIDTPFLFGVLRPRIYLPFRMPEEMRAPVIAHEQAHLKRLDPIWKLCGYILLAVYWFHPLCWAAYVLFCRDVELACDEKVIRGYDSHQKKAYSEALLACSTGRHPLAAYPLAFGEAGVKKRIRSVLNYKKPAFWAVTAAVAACGAAAVCFLTDPVEPDKSPEGSSLSETGSLGQTPDQLAETDLTGQTPDRLAETDLTGQTPDRLAETDLTGQAPDRLAETESAGQTPGGESDTDLLTAALRKWSTAFVSRDGETIASMASDEVTADLEAREFLSGPAGKRSFGMSSPWPTDPQLDVSLYSFGSGTAEIHYYAWSSEPHITVWKELLSYELDDGNYLITSEELTWLDEISSGEAFAQAYGNDADITGTRMDYKRNGAGELLNRQALLSSTTQYQSLWEPESAAAALLNLSDDPAEVQVERLFEEEDITGLQITFLRDGTSVQIAMVQLFGSYGIWVPQSYQVNALYRLSRMDWDEIRSRNLRPEGTPDWSDIVCIGRIPEYDITLYGYNDAESFGRGTAIEIDGNVNYFDWIYTTPRTLLPECFWDEKHRQLQTALNIYTGTGVAAQELHVLQQYDTGTLQDNVFAWDDFTSALQERITFRYDKDTGRLTLSSGLPDQKLLAEAEISEGHVESLELGNISRFVLGETIFFQVEPGYYTGQSSAIAEYENMPTLEAEVLIQESGSGLSFTLGEIRAR